MVGEVVSLDLKGREREETPIGCPGKQVVEKKNLKVVEKERLQVAKEKLQVEQMGGQYHFLPDH